MGVLREIVVLVGVPTMKFDSSHSGRVDVNCRIADIRERMAEVVRDFDSNFVSIGGGNSVGYRYMRLDLQAVAQPAGANVGYAFDARDMADLVSYLVGYLRIDAIEHARKYRFGRIPDDLEDKCRNQQPGDRIGQWKTYPQADGSGQDAQRCEAVDTGVEPVGDEGGAVYFAPDPDSKNRHRLVADKADYAGCGNRADEIDAYRVEQPVNGFVTGDDRTDQNHQDDGCPGQVFDTTQAVGKSLAWRATRK